MLFSSFLGKPAVKLCGARGRGGAGAREDGSPGG
jgi:hypothetical protein